jgi:hypothetical protein
MVSDVKEIARPQNRCELVGKREFLPVLELEPQLSACSQYAD